jgi:hypothetical protein
MTTEERLERIERMLEEALARGDLIDPNRAYSDKEVCVLLGGISLSTLYRIRKRGLLETVELYEGGSTRTTGRRIIEYMEAREQKADVLNFTGTGRKRSAA